MLHVSSFQILSEVKTGLHRYCACATRYSRDGANQMWNLKNSKDMLECNQGSCTHEILLKHLTSRPSTQPFSTRN